MSFLSRIAPPAAFPTYLLESLPFRRRKPSTDSTTSTSSNASISPLDAPPQPTYLNGHKSYLKCGRCSADLCFTSSIVSRGFTGRWGRAFLVSPSASTNEPSETALADHTALPNTYIHRPVPRQLVTGAHTVSDVSCSICGNILGWKYVAAEEESQRYKVGKFILEMKRVVVAACWEDGEGTKKPMPPTFLDGREGSVDDIEFDSQDEDECEELFAGLWTPEAAAKRRQSRFRR